MNVLVTDATYSNALAAVRSLGRRGARVTVCSEKRLTQCSFSRYTSESVRCPSPKEHELFAQALKRISKVRGIDVILPIGYDSNVALSKHLDIMEDGPAVPVAPWKSMEVGSDKMKTMELARELGVPTPRTYSGPEEVDRFPVVVKDALGSGRVRYANDVRQLQDAYAPGAVIQEYVPGDGYGFFALYDRGEQKASFMHRRLREFPVTGGASTAAVSVRDETLKDLGSRMLTELKWHGVAMAEFKKDRRDGVFKLIELNPKFWGSLDLSIASGVDFPFLCAKMAAGGGIENTTAYGEGIVFRWPFPQDLVRAVATCSLLSFVSEFLDDSVRTNVDFDDLAPNVMQMLSVPSALGSALKAGGLRYPHGKVVID